MANNNQRPMPAGRGGHAANFAQKRPPLDKKTLKRLLSYLAKGYKMRILVVMLCILISSLTGVAGSLFIQRLIDDYIAPLLLESAPVFSKLLGAITTMACIYLVGIISAYTYNRTMVSISQGILKTIRDEMFEKMQKLPIGYFDSHTHGDVMSHYTNDTDTLRQMISQGVPQMFSSAITVVAVFGAMLYLSVWLTIFVVAFVFVMLRFVKSLGGKSAHFFIEQQRSLGDVNGYIEEMISGQKVVKVFCHEEESKRDFDEKNERLCYSAVNANRFANTLMPIMANLGHLQYVLIAVIGSFMALLGVTNVGLSGVSTLTLGSIASFLMLSKSFNMPISQISQQLNSIIMALAGAQRIFELMDEQPEEDNGTVTLVNAEMKNGILVESDKRTNLWAWKEVTPDLGVKLTQLCGDVRLIDVTFGYAEDKPVLHDVSLYAKPGQKIAFVGATGAGKTTITNLINRFYDVWEGEILYDGIDVRRIRKEDLRRSLGIVLQDVNLFTGTIMDNIRYGKLDATDEECIAAAKLANAHGFISRLPNGYDTVISGDGGSLSQGQRQLLSIARAAVADPPVMILDEATSSIDTRTEAIVQRGMDRLMEGRTVFVIAHRLSTVRDAKAIMVLDHGRIIERGDHDDLIAQKGKYYQLYTGAFELE
ncbi:MAG: ABC transporter ATP-binding protein [Oscillospiraceae bacterium]|nr:ABC transporter ATP-binding protein [Oscillospiraceae bacterium]